MSGMQDGQTTTTNEGQQVSVRSETLDEIIDWLKAQADCEWECAQEGLSDGYDGFDAYTRTIEHCQDMLLDDTAEGGKNEQAE